MTPFHASGAGQAIEDAYILASLLARALSSSSSSPQSSISRTDALSRVSKALQAYSNIRRPIAYDVQARSRYQGRVVTLEEEKIRLETGETPWSAEETKKVLEDGSSWGKRNLPNEQVERAREMFESMVTG